MPPVIPLVPNARRSALVWTLGVLVVATLAGSVRVLPWILDPTVPLRVAIPFTRTLAEAALEVALLVGWPLGWAMAAHVFVERGEARVLLLLGEHTRITTARLLPHGAALAGALAIVGFIGGRDASEPGRVASDLVSHARASCEHSSEKALVVPFVNAAWLCRSDAEPRLYVSGPGNLPVTGSEMRLSGDLRRIELDDARLRISETSVHVNSLVVGGLAPWGHAQSLSPIARGLVLSLSALAAACAAVMLILRRMGRTRLGALLVGAAGPLAVLGAMRLFDRADARGFSYVLLPVIALASASVVAWLASRLLGRRRSVRV